MLRDGMRLTAMICRVQISRYAAETATKAARRCGMKNHSTAFTALMIVKNANTTWGTPRATSSAVSARYLASMSAL
jgi:hypothetical protein